MPVVIFHTSVAPPDQQAARSLLEAGQLARFETTVVDDPASLRQRAFTAAGRLARRDLARQFRRRAVTEVPLAKVRSHPWGELLRLAAGSVDTDGRLTDFVWERAEIGFDRAVSRGLREGLTGVYGYEHSSLGTFQRAKQLGIRVAYEMPAPESRHSKRIIDAELERFPEMKTPYHAYTAEREHRRIARRMAEWNAADVVLAASRYTRDSFASLGLDVGKVRLVPIGAPPPLPREQALAGRSRGGKPTFVWAGTFGIRKGAHHLLSAWRDGQLGRSATLKVFGSIALPERVLRPLPEGVEICGSIPRPELMGEYLKGDALIFPTLCDGWGMVATEAWSCGLPVITTDAAGVADFLSDRANGLLIKAGDPGAIRAAIEWCLSNMPRLEQMREPALETAAKWQWSDYRRLLSDTLREAGLFAGAS
ncbi:MAG TPA: glycosyltransferase family 4 protein [Opitutaceae bacterium]